MAHRRHTRPQPRRLVDWCGSRWTNGDSVERKSPVGQRGERTVVGLPLDLCEIGPLVAVTWIGEAVLEWAIRRENHEALGVPVEEPGRIQTRFMDELGQGAGAGRGVRREREPGDHVERLVEHDYPDHRSS